jgi:hypothetical protein
LRCAYASAANVDSLKGKAISAQDVATIEVVRSENAKTANG